MGHWLWLLDDEDPLDWAGDMAGCRVVFCAGSSNAPLAPPPTLLTLGNLTIFVSQSSLVESLGDKAICELLVCCWRYCCSWMSCCWDKLAKRLSSDCAACWPILVVCCCCCFLAAFSIFIMSHSCSTLFTLAVVCCICCCCCNCWLWSEYCFCSCCIFWAVFMALMLPFDSLVVFMIVLLLDVLLVRLLR